VRLVGYLKRKSLILISVGVTDNTARDCEVVSSVVVANLQEELRGSGYHQAFFPCRVVK
jgi:hypothetical protein